VVATTCRKDEKGIGRSRSSIEESTGGDEGTSKQSEKES